MAMEGSIRVAPQVLTETTTQFESLMKEAESLREEMNSSITGMSSVWEGETFDTYKTNSGNYQAVSVKSMPRSRNTCHRSGISRTNI